MRPIERRQRIVDLVRQYERVTVDALTEALATSQETIRRDLVELAGQGLLVKFHGGAAVLPRGEFENAFQTRMHEQATEKRALAARTAQLFSDGDSVFMDTGTTTLFCAKALSTLNHLTVVTNSVSIAQTLARLENKVFLLGGEYVAESQQNVGALVVEQIKRFHADHAIITVGALTTHGALDFLIEEAEVARAMVAQARTLTVLADATKFNRGGLFHLFPLERIDRLVVDRLPEAELLEAMRRADIEIFIA